MTLLVKNGLLCSFIDYTPLCASFSCLIFSLCIFGVFLWSPFFFLGDVAPVSILFMHARLVPPPSPPMPLSSRATKGKEKQGSRGPKQAPLAHTSDNDKAASAKVAWVQWDNE
jgi:hypothetical protein